MSESRESSLAAILARGLMRVRRRAECSGNRQTPDGDSQNPPARSIEVSPSTNNAVDTSKKGEHE